MAQDWDIKPRADGCSACEQPFGDGAACHSALLFDAEGYRRRDFCTMCWEARQGEASPVSTWQSVFHLPPPAPEEALKKETAETLLRRLIEEDAESHADVIYILAVMLERKRQFIERATQNREDGVLIRIYECRRTNETFLVRDPLLSLDELEPVQIRVVSMLGGGAPEGGGPRSEVGDQRSEVELPTANCP